MAPSSRDRICVDLQGLKEALFEHAKAVGISPSGLVRTVVAEALGRSELPSIRRFAPSHHLGKSDRVRLSLRMPREQAAATFEAARRAGLNPGDFVGGLVAGIPVLMDSGRRADHLVALIESSAELSALSRSINQLTALLRHGSVRQAQKYREMLDTLGGDVRRHLELASRVLADVRPRCASTSPVSRV